MIGGGWGRIMVVTILTAAIFIRTIITLRKSVTAMGAVDAVPSVGAAEVARRTNCREGSREGRN